MRFDTQYRIHEAAGEANSRYTINGIKLEGKQLIATDGHILAVVPCEPSATDHDGLLPNDAIQAALQAARKEKRQAEIAVNGKATVTSLKDAKLEMPLDCGQFPNWQAVVREPGDPTIAFDVDLLVRLSRALGTSHVRFHIKDNNSSIVVTPNESGAAQFGVLMPMRF